jgi:hypothetical protein
MSDLFFATKQYNNFAEFHHSFGMLRIHISDLHYTKNSALKKLKFIPELPYHEYTGRLRIQHKDNTRENTLTMRRNCCLEVRHDKKSDKLIIRAVVCVDHNHYIGEDIFRFYPAQNNTK